MGFECALAIVLPSPEGSVPEFYPRTNEQDQVDGDIFFEDREKVFVPALVWRVVKFIDFGRVRALEKASSSLSPSQRAGDDSVARAAICTASYLLEHVYELERKTRIGSEEFVLPLVSDPFQALSFVDGANAILFENRYSSLFERLGSRSVIQGLWKMRGFDFNRQVSQEEMLGEVVHSIFWIYNQALLTKPKHEAPFSTVGYSILWDGSGSVADRLDELLIHGDVAGEELRKELSSIVFVEIWRDTLRAFEKLGARVIFLTDYFHLASCSSIRSQERYL